MARRKRSSKALERAERRAAALMSIDSNLDLGNGLTLEGFYQMIDDVRQKLTSYNTLLSTVDAAYNNMLGAERLLLDQSEQMLLGVAFHYGKDSSEYEMAGGVRKSERKRRSRREAVEPSSEAEANSAPPSVEMSEAM